MKKSIHLWLIRHGKTRGNEEKRYVGRTDEPLSPKGREELLNKSFPGVSILFSSPMARCLESCECFWPGMEVKQIASFREIDFGVFEGKNYQELSGDKDYQAWIDSGGTMTFPKGEDRRDFILRSLRGVQEMMQEIGKIPSCQVTAGAVVHGGTIMAILSEMLGGDYYDYQIRNGEGYSVRIELDGEKYKILSAERMNGE